MDDYSEFLLVWETEDYEDGRAYFSSYPEVEKKIGILTKRGLNAYAIYQKFNRGEDVNER